MKAKAHAWMLSVIKLVYLHSNKDATEYTAKYHIKPECNCRPITKEGRDFVSIKMCKYRYEAPDIATQWTPNTTLSQENGVVTKMKSPR